MNIFINTMTFFTLVLSGVNDWAIVELEGVEAQKNQNWCYAATVKIILSTFGNDKEQHEIVRDLKNLNYSCASYDLCSQREEGEQINASLMQRLELDNNSPCFEPFLNTNINSLTQYINDNLPEERGFKYVNGVFNHEKLKKSIKEFKAPVRISLVLGGANSNFYHDVIISGYYVLATKRTGFFRLGSKRDSKVIYLVNNPGSLPCNTCKYLMIVDFLKTESLIYSDNQEGSIYFMPNGTKNFEMVYATAN